MRHYSLDAARTACLSTAVNRIGLCTHVLDSRCDGRGPFDVCAFAARELEALQAAAPGHGRRARSWTAESGESQNEGDSGVRRVWGTHVGMQETDEEAFVVAPAHGVFAGACVYARTGRTGRGLSLDNSNSPVKVSNSKF